MARCIGNTKPTVCASVLIVSLPKRLTIGVIFASGILFCSSFATCNEFPVPEK